MNRHLGSTLGTVEALLDRSGGAVAALAAIAADGYSSVEAFIEEVQSRTSARYVYFESRLPELEAAIGLCEAHGEQIIRETGATPGPDPWTSYRLACGCTVVPL